MMDGALAEILALLDAPSEQWRPEKETFYWTIDGEGHIYSPFAQSIPTIMNFQLPVERSTQPQPLQDFLL
jgi:hypothetical protein